MTGDLVPVGGQDIDRWVCMDCGEEGSGFGQHICPETWDAGRVVGSVVVTCGLTDVLVPPSWKAIVGRHAKALLEEGFPGDLVNAACYMAVLRGRPEIAQYIAGDLMLAKAGASMSRAEYEQKLALYAAGNGRAAELLAEQRERLAAREADIERRRAG